jgi:hypothetical protein
MKSATLPALIPERQRSGKWWGQVRLATSPCKLAPSTTGFPRTSPLASTSDRTISPYRKQAGVLTTRELGGEATEGADVLTFNDAGKPVTFEALGDTAQFDRVFAK